MKTNGNEWQRMTTSGKTNESEWEWFESSNADSL